jgi:cyclase
LDKRIMPSRRDVLEIFTEKYLLLQEAAMQAKRIIPCLDVDDGRVVKGVKFKGIQDAGDPVEMARRYNDEGADELTFLDIGASYKSRATLLDVVRRVAAEVFIPLCVGGGIREVEDMRDAMNAGADKVSVCTSALKNPPLLAAMAKAYGRQCVVLSIDAKRVPLEPHDAVEFSHRENSERNAPRFAWHAFSHGGREDTGLDAIQWAVQAVELGAGEILLNSIDADGTGDGYDLELTRLILEAVPVPVIASGGAGNLEQIARVLLPLDGSAGTGIGNSDTVSADAALVASMLHFGKTTIPEIKKFAESKGVCVRW